MSTRHAVVGPEPHVLPVWIYWAVFSLLVLLTLLTVYLAEFDFGEFSVIVTLAIAGTKSLLVLAVFMHLWFDSKFYALILGTSLIFLSLFVFFPLMDLDSRDWVEKERANFLKRDETVYEHHLKSPKDLPLGPGLKEWHREDLVFEGPHEE